MCKLFCCSHTIIVNIFFDFLKQDCNCGARDPDCNVPWEKIFGCNDTMSIKGCSLTGQCQYFPVKVIPQNWTCPFSDYADGSVCNCNCGAALDPDCTAQPVLPNDCPCSTMTCSPSGFCQGFF